MFLIRSPTLIFILGNFILRINKSDEELNKLKRRDRIRTQDLVFLDKKFIQENGLRFSNEN